MILRIAWGWGSGEAQIDSHIKQLAQEAGINIIHSYDWGAWSSSYKQKIFAACAKYGVKLMLFEQWPGWWPGEKGVGDYVYDWVNPEDGKGKPLFEAIKNEPCIWGMQIEEPGDDATCLPVGALTNVYKELKSLNSNWQVFCAFGWTSWPRNGHAVDGYFDSFGIDIYECHYADVKARIRFAMGSTSNPTSMLSKSLYLINTLNKIFIPVIQATNYKRLSGSGGVCPNCLKNQQEVYQELLPRNNPGDLCFYEMANPGFFPPYGGTHCIWEQVKKLSPGPPPPPPEEEITCPQCKSRLRIYK